MSQHPNHLTFRKKLAYGIADIGASLAYVTINFFLLDFLINDIRLNPTLAGLAVLIGRLIDAITDPLMGSLSDHTRSRWGRRKPYIWLGIIPIGLSFMLLWFIPTANSQFFTFMLAALLFSLHTICYTVIQMPYLALTPDLAPEYHQRTVLSSFRAGFGTFASLLAAALPPILVSLRAGAEGWQLMGLVFGIIISLSYLPVALFIKEPSYDMPQEQLSLKGWLRDYQTVVAVRGFSRLLALFMALTMAIGVLSSILPFYLTSVLGLEGSNQSLILAILFLTAIASLILWNVISKRYGKPFALVVGLIVMALSIPLLVYLSPSGVISMQLIALSMLCGVGLGAVMLFPWAMLPDVIDRASQGTKVKREGMFYALFTFGQKLAVALGIFINAWALDVVGYVAKAESQSSGALSGIRELLILAAVIFALASLLLYRYPIRSAINAKF